MDYVRKFIPEADDKMIEGWEKDGSLEFMIIDGVKRYFNRSHTNLFRINRTAKIRKAEVSGKSKDDLDLLLENLVPDILSDIESRNGNSGKAEKIKLNYQVSVPPGTVPEGEIIRCWLPYPREGTGRQEIIDFHSEDEFIISDNSNLQRSVYFEKIAESNKPTVFSYNLVISTQAESFSINEFSVNEYAKDSSYFYHISERPPHIVFTDKIKNLSEKIVGNEKNPYLAAKKIFSWISKNIPWAGAREYSTIRNISDYAITNMHGDCGIKTILFMTLARYNGIPTKWQSGWMLHPGEVNLHDWGEIYFEGYGWVPVDQSFGLIDSEDPKIKYFYLGGIDQYRFTVNDDYSRPLYPAKIFPRSETVDFQRGEVEWSGGNLYFDKWDYSMEIEYLTE
jgi:transglutaminase-like putative cysteine protease